MCSPRVCVLVLTTFVPRAPSITHTTKNIRWLGTMHVATYTYTYGVPKFANQNIYNRKVLEELSNKSLRNFLNSK